MHFRNVVSRSLRALPGATVQRDFIMSISTLLNKKPLIHWQLSRHEGSA